MFAGPGFKFSAFLVWMAGVFLELRGVLGGHTSTPCPTRKVPEGSAIGRNFDERSGKPLFWLEIPRRVQRGYKPGAHYLFRVHAESPQHPFDDVILTVDSAGHQDSAKCGSGRLDANSTHLYQPRHCPNIVTTTIKEPMQHANFRWTAPSCGCVHVRATVIAENGVYYLDSDDVTDGSLTKTICLHGSKPFGEKGRADPHTGKHVGNHLDGSKHEANMEVTIDSATDRLPLLCEEVHKVRGTALVKQQSLFMLRRQLGSLTPFQLRQLIIALEHRRADVINCCKKESEEKMECLEDVRRLRIDNFCGNGMPDVPFIEHRSDWMTKRRDNCCWKRGEDRYSCFSYKNDMVRDDNGHGEENVYSLDESDPLTDLEDYLPQRPQVVSTPLPKLDSQPSKEQEADVGLSDKRDEPESAHERHSKSDSIHTSSVHQRHENTNTEMSPATEKLKEQIQRSVLKAQCCLEGERLGKVKTSESTWRVCKNGARAYVSQLRTGRRRCHNVFLECCCEEAERLDDLASHEKETPDIPGGNSEHRTSDGIQDDFAMIGEEINSGYSAEFNARHQPDMDSNERGGESMGTDHADSDSLESASYNPGGIHGKTSIDIIQDWLSEISTEGSQSSMSSIDSDSIERSRRPSRRGHGERYSDDISQRKSIDMRNKRKRRRRLRRGPDTR